MVEFFGRVQDQTVNLTPMGTETGQAIVVPRLEGWLAACELYEVPQEIRAEIIDLSRAMFEATQDRLNDREANRAAPEAMVPPELVN